MFGGITGPCPRALPSTAVAYVDFPWREELAEVVAVAEELVEIEPSEA